MLHTLLIYYLHAVTCSSGDCASFGRRAPAKGDRLLEAAASAVASATWDGGRLFFSLVMLMTIHSMT
jgi:hypothetical protein